MAGAANKLTAEQLAKLGTPDAPKVTGARDGEEHAYPDVRFDAEKGANYILDSRGQRVYHGTPDGFRFKKDGTLEARGDVAEQQSAPPPESAPPGGKA